MSSIYGKINYNGQPLPIQELSLMEKALNHWNADDQGQWLEGCSGLGHLMLYNTPESLQEKLPLHHSASKRSITADARIDNREELFKKLNLDLINQAAIPDSTLILKAYEKYGEDCVQHLIGDFAFAIWDEQEQKLFCARDHMGVKPFFYYQDERFFAFATEKKGILCLDGVNKSIDEQFFYNQLIFPVHQAADATLYKQIRRLPPAHTLCVYPRRSKLKLQSYWTLDATSEIKLPSEQDYYEGLLEHFERAVRCRLRSAYPVGADLSGGMDSSAITGVANAFLKKEGKDLFTFSNTLPDGIEDARMLQADARKYIDLVIDFNQIREAVYVTEEIWDDPLDEMDFTLRVNDGLDAFSPYWQFPSRQKAMEKGVRSIFSGFPGDQMITTRGRNYFLDLLDKKQYKAYVLAPQRFNSGFHKLRPFLPDGLVYRLLHLSDRLGFYKKNIRISEEIFNIPALFKARHKDVLWEEPGFREIYTSYRHNQKFNLLKPAVSQRLETESRYGLYFRLEPRFPMADIRLNQFFLSLPNELKYKGVLSRPVFRKAMKNYLPEELLAYDSKSGGNAPFFKVNQHKREKAMETLIQDLPNHKLIKKEAILKRALQNKELHASGNRTSNNTQYSLHLHALAFRWLADKNNLDLFAK